MCVAHVCVAHVCVARGRTRAAEAPRDFLGFRDKPNGVVLLDECNVRLRDDKVVQIVLRCTRAALAAVSCAPVRASVPCFAQTMRPFTFVLSHAGGESVVLAAESEKEMHEWMQAVRTSRMCVSDAAAANMLEEVSSRQCGSKKA